MYLLGIQFLVLNMGGYVTFRECQIRSAFSPLPFSPTPTLLSADAQSKDVPRIFPQITPVRCAKPVVVAIANMHKQEKAVVGVQRIANDDGQIVTWMPQNHHVSLGPTPEDLDLVPVRFKLSNYVVISTDQP